jgi:hypothetical protein
MPFKYPALKVIHIPDWSNGNPYQKELTNALSEMGIKTFLSNGTGRFPILGMVKFFGMPNILHFHLVHLFLLSDNRLMSVLHSLRFVLQVVLLKLMRVKFVWTVHNISDHEKSDRKIELLVYRILVRLFDRILVHCGREKSQVVDNYNCSLTAARKIEIVPHGHYFKSYPNDFIREEARKELGINEKEFVYLFFGSLRK